MERKAQIRKLNDGTEIEIRSLDEKDFERSLRFFQELTEEDRLHMRVNVADPLVVRLRLQNVESENVWRLGAFQGTRLVGDGVLRWPKYGWMSHVGDIRAVTVPDFRRRGLATLLFRELFLHGVREGLEKIEARMLQSQVSVRACVEKLGFTEEGILPGFAMDLAGRMHDMVIMSTSVEGL